MGHHYISEIQNEKFEFTSKSRIMLTVILVIGLALAGIGAMKAKSHWAEHKTASAVTAENHQPEGHATAQHEGHEHQATSAKARGEEEHTTAKGHHEKSWLTQLWANILLNSYYFMLFTIGALFFIAVNYAANAGWSTLVKRIAEAITGYLPVAFITLTAVVIFGKGELYHWYEYLSQGLIEGDTGYDAILSGKTWFLNNASFSIGVPVIIGAWILFRYILRKASINEDLVGGNTNFEKSFKFSAGFIAFFAFSFSILSWMLMMSIDAHWFSTIFSIYNFAIAFVTGLTVIMFFTLYLKSQGYLEVVSDEVIHDLGKFMFAFCIFWGYIWVSQFLLIWYANLPEETVYFDARLTPHYKPLFLINIVMNFALPFLILMMRKAKRTPKVILVAGSIILLGHWLDVYLMVMPGTVGEMAEIGLLEIGTTMVFAAIFIYVVLQGLTKASLITKNHPYVLESANHDVGV
jgi:hypothetical protein